jgi:hypothetical protein
VVHNCGFSETFFFVVCDDIWIAIYPSFVVVIPYTFDNAPFVPMLIACIDMLEKTSYCNPHHKDVINLLKDHMCKHLQLGM